MRCTRESHKVKSVLGSWFKVAGRHLFCSGVVILLSTPFFVASAYASEASLRVAFVYNFLKFIEWPQAKNQPISLCALGAGEATRQALAQVEKKSRQQRPVHIIYLDNNADVGNSLDSCQMVYRPVSGEHLLLPQLLPSGVLLVADEPSASDSQVGIALIRTTDNRIEFLINKQAVMRSGVKISSQLLKLAKKPKTERR